MFTEQRWTMKKRWKIQDQLFKFKEIPNVIETDKGKFKIIKKDTCFFLCSTFKISHC